MRKTALALLLCFLAGSLRGGETESLPVSLLRAAGRVGELRRLAVAWWLLEQHGRVLPENVSPELCESIAGAMLHEGGGASWSSLPSADHLSLREDRVEGGNFAFIDHLISLEGRPIALDRHLPVLLAPLSPERAEALEQRRQKFQSDPEAGLVKARWNRFHQQEIAASFVADGVAVRPYAGRADDWYHALVQEGTPYTQLEFFATIESWPERAYHPLTGVGTVASTPPVWFHLSDVLSRGALSAVRAGLTPGGPLQRNPYVGLAMRVLPHFRQQFAQLEAGAELAISVAVLEEARLRRLRLAPPSVAPLFRDPARFLGAAGGNDWLLASNPRKVPNLPAAEPDLPSRPASVSETAALGYWEDPAASTPEPLTPPLPTSAASSMVSAPAPAPAPSDANAVPISSFRVAILLPTVEEAEDYVQAIAANESELTANAASLGRARAIQRWSQQALPLLSDPATAPLRTACEAAAKDCATRTEQLREERFDLLTARSLHRRRLLNSLRQERLPEFLASFSDARSL